MGFDDESNESLAEQAAEAVEQGGDLPSCLDCDEIEGSDDVTDDGGEG